MLDSRLWGVVPVLVLGVVAGGLAMAPRAAAGERTTLVLDETAYTHAYYRFARDSYDGEALEAQGEQVLGLTTLRRLERRERRRLQTQDPHHAARETAAAWTEQIPVQYLQGFHYLDKPYPAAPEHWAELDFDDSGWVRRRTPLQMGRMWMSTARRWRSDRSAQTRESYHDIHTSYFRSYFYIENPQRDAPLTLSMRFRGGVRVLVNGEEIARSHLPEGALNEQTRAQGYGIEAYRLEPEELLPPHASRLTAREDGLQAYYRVLFDGVRDLPLAYEEAVVRYGADAPIDKPDPDALAGTDDVQALLAALDPHQAVRIPSHRVPGGGEVYVSREAWQRLYDARERRLDAVTIPADKLRAGRNVLAIELRAAPVHPVVIHDEDHGETRRGGTHWFSHSRIGKLRLTSPSPHAVSALERPAGMQVWSGDPHDELFSADFLEPGAPAPVIRFTAARNGVFGAPLVVGSDTDLHGLEVRVSDLRHAQEESAVTADHVRVRAAEPRPATSLDMLDTFLRLKSSATLATVARRYGGNDVYSRSGQQVVALLNEIEHMDALTDEASSRVAGGRSMVFWLELAPPADVPPGSYRGTATVSAAGVEPVEVPVHLELFDWRMPDRGHFRTVAGAVSSRYALASEAGVEPYSDAHWALLRRSHELLGRIGAGDWLAIAVLDNEHEVKWIRREDGTLAFDLSTVERLLELVIETCGPPRVVSFNIMGRKEPGDELFKARVPVRDAGEDAIEWVDLGPGADPELRESYWRAFAYAVEVLMQRKGLGDRLYWGKPADGEVGDPEMLHLMRAFLPEVHWTRRSHAHMPDQHYRATSTVLAANMLFGEPVNTAARRASGIDPPKLPVDGLRSALGWRGAAISLNNSRRGSTTHELYGPFPPFAMRLLAERNLIAGYSGYGVWGADHYYTNTGVRNTVDSGVARLFWHNGQTIHESVRARNLLEGTQENEARIFIERALVLELLPESLAQRAKDVLNHRIEATGHLPIRYRTVVSLADLPQHWRRRSAELFALAAEVAQHVGLELDRDRIELAVLAGSRLELDVPIRYAAGTPRTFTVESDAPAIAVAPGQGTLTGPGAMTITLDARDAEPGDRITGTVTLFDRDNRREHTLAVHGRAVRPLELQTAHLYVREGETRRVDTLLVNHGREPVAWSAEPSEPWLSLVPANGSLAPGERHPVQLSAGPPHKGDHRIESVVRFLNGSNRELARVPVVTQVESPQPAVPDDRMPEYLVDLDAWILEHYTLDPVVRNMRDVPDRPHREGLHLLGVPLRQDGRKAGDANDDRIIYDIAGRGLSTFAAEVAFAGDDYGEIGRVRFQVITDGQVRFDSGLLGPDPRRIAVVVPHLRDVRRIELVMIQEHAAGSFRHDRDREVAVWLEPRFYQF